jgi:hypothetical protein
VSGIEITLSEGELFIGSLPGARKTHDLRHEPRFALHSNLTDHSMAGGDAKVSGRARELIGAERGRIQEQYPDVPADADVFILDIEEVAFDLDSRRSPAY